MRDRPRTWPSIRLSRLRHGALIWLRMIDTYPPWVCSSRLREPRKVRARPKAVPVGKHHHPAHAHGREGRWVEPSRAPVPAGTIYTGPMHPQIRQVGPGHCPICGMALEPELAGDAGPNAELVDMTRRFSIGLVFSFPVVPLGVGGHLANLPLPLPSPFSTLLPILFPAPPSLFLP